jgi:hypothetical protein
MKNKIKLLLSSHNPTGSTISCAEINKGWNQCSMQNCKQCLWKSLFQIGIKVSYNYISNQASRFVFVLILRASSVPVLYSWFDFGGQLPGWGFPWYSSVPSTSCPINNYHHPQSSYQWIETESLNSSRMNLHISFQLTVKYSIFITQRNITLHNSCDVIFKCRALSMSCGTI